MNNNPVTSGDIEEKKGRKREVGKDFGGIVIPRPKKKKIVKKISSEVEEVEEELKPRLLKSRNPGCPCRMMMGGRREGQTLQSPHSARSHLAPPVPGLGPGP